MSDIFRVRKSRKTPKLSSPNVYAEPSASEIRKLVERARAISEQLDEVKPLYNELDQITMSLSTVQDKLSKYGVAVIDNFEAKNTQFKIAAISRFKLQWVLRGGK